MQCSERGGAPVSDGTVPLVGATVVRAIFPPPLLTTHFATNDERRAWQRGLW